MAGAGEAWECAASRAATRAPPQRAMARMRRVLLWMAGRKTHDDNWSERRPDRPARRHRPADNLRGGHAVPQPYGGPGGCRAEHGSNDLHARRHTRSTVHMPRAPVVAWRVSTYRLRSIACISWDGSLELFCTRCNAPTGPDPGEKFVSRTSPAAQRHASLVRRMPLRHPFQARSEWRRRAR